MRTFEDIIKDGLVQNTTALAEAIHEASLKVRDGGVRSTLTAAGGVADSLIEHMAELLMTGQTASLRIGAYLGLLDFLLGRAERRAALMIADTGHVRRAKEVLAKWIKENMAQDKEDKGNGNGKG